MKKALTIREVNIVLHENLQNRRVKYNEKDFDVLVVHITSLQGTKSYAINSQWLPDNDSIHFSYLTKPIWSPKDISEHFVEVTDLNI